jgi:hypothetical protein
MTGVLTLTVVSTLLNLMLSALTVGMATALETMKSKNEESPLIAASAVSPE